MSLSAGSDMRSSLLLMQYLGNLDGQLLIAIETRSSCSDILAAAAFSLNKWNREVLEEEAELVFGGVGMWWVLPHCHQ